RPVLRKQDVFKYKIDDQYKNFILAGYSNHHPWAVLILIYHASPALKSFPVLISFLCPLFGLVKRQFRISQRKVAHRSSSIRSHSHSHL
ncbi:MAG: hypothetical protein OSJ28_06095, partial [Desulfovibrio sp.]|nr:hypothetical protein [Desulfovibrio sp.]